LIGASSSSLASSRFTFPSEDIAVRSAGRRVLGWMTMTFFYNDFFLHAVIDW
jgi:hypothetical protein